MNQAIIASAHSQSLNSRLIATAISFTLALIMLAGVGFIQGNNGAVHNAAHDTRHSIGFPCH